MRRVDEQMLAKVRELVMPSMTRTADEAWIIDDTSFPRKAAFGRGASSVLRGNSAMLSRASAGNCQVVVTLSIANHQLAADRLSTVSAREWTNDASRPRPRRMFRARSLQDSPQIALEQFARLCWRHSPGVVLMMRVWIQQLLRQPSRLGLCYVAPIVSTVKCARCARTDPQPPRVSVKIWRSDTAHTLGGGWGGAPSRGG